MSKLGEKALTMQKQVLQGLPRILLFAVVMMFVSLPLLCGSLPERAKAAPTVVSAATGVVIPETKSPEPTATVSVPAKPKASFKPPENTSILIDESSFYDYSADQAKPVQVKLSSAPQAVLTAAVSGASAEILRSLKPDELQLMMARLKPLPPSVVTKQVPIDTAPRLPTGNISKLRFPASALALLRQPPPVKSAPLTVSRWSPLSASAIGEETTQLIVQFSQQMVALSSVDSVAGWQPVQLTPQPKGKWRWLDTRTIVFEPSNYRFPMSTLFQVSIPKGTVSKVTGSALAQTVSWQFSSRQLKLEHHYPSSYGNLDRPELFVHFNQTIVDKDVFPHVNVFATAKNGIKSKVPVRLLTMKETSANTVLKAAIKKFKKNTWLCCKPINKLAPGQIITFVISRQTPSAEGPLLSTKDLQFWFETQPIPTRFALADPDQNTITTKNPGNSMVIRFNHEIKEDQFRQDMVKVVPPLKQCWIQVSHDSLYVEGLTYAGTTYSVTVSDRLRDKLGQKLAAPVNLKFKMVPYDQQLYMASGSFITSPSCMPKDFFMYTVNYPMLETRVYVMKPEEFSDFVVSNPSDWLKHVGRKPLFSKTERLKHRTDRLCETRLDLSRFMPTGYGHLVVTAQPIGSNGKADTDNLRAVWIQTTDIAMNVWNDEKNMRVFASQLSTGQPLEGLQLSLGSVHSSTAKTGFGTLVLPDLPSDSESTNKTEFLIARHKSDSAILNNSFQSSYAGDADSSRWYVFTDRGVYKPGSEVNFKGWLRKLPRVPGKELTAIKFGQVVVRVEDRDGKIVYEGKVGINEFGGFHGKFLAPDKMAVGTARISFESASDSSESTAHSVLIADFRTPDFSLKLEPRALPMVAGSNIAFETRASYYAGGPLAGSQIKWNVSGSSTTYTPTGWSEYDFGNFEEEQSFDQHFSSTTDSAGEHALQIKVPTVLKRPVSVSVGSEVQDINRETHSANSVQIIHPSSLYVGLKANRNFVMRNEQVPWSMIVCDLDGKPVQHKKVKLSLTREVGSWGNTSWKLVNAFMLDSSSHPLNQKLVCNQSGEYRLEATVTDDQGRKNSSVVQFFAASFDGESLDENIVLKLDKESYEPGDTARLLVRSKYAQAKGILLTEHNGISSSRNFELKNGRQFLTIPIEDWQASELKLTVTLLANNSSEKDNVLSEVFSENAQINISYSKRTLHLTCRPDSTKTVPGTETGVLIHVEDQNKKALPHSEVAIAVVDDAVLQLTEYQLPSFEDVWRQHYVNVSTFALQPSIQRSASPAFRNNLRYEFPGWELEEMEKAAPGKYSRTSGGSISSRGSRGGSGAGAGNDNAAPFIERENFNPLAVFVGSAVSDKDGNVRMRYKLPDSLTRYRIMAVATDGGKKFGKGEALITVSLPVSVKPSPPRFLNFRDQFQLPVTVKNTTDKPLDVMVAVRGSTKELVNGGGKLVRVPSNNRIEVRFSTTADSLGKLHFQAAVASGNGSDAVDFSVPVLMPATTEAMTTSGRIDDQEAVQLELDAPRDALADYGGLEVSTGATIAGEGLGAIQYLKDYPHQCSEQLASRIFCFAISKNLAKLQPESNSGKDDMQKIVANDIKLLCSRQSSSGAFGLWAPNDGFEVSMPFVSIYAAHALSIARARGLSVPDAAIDRASKHLKALEASLSSEDSSKTPNHGRMRDLTVSDHLLSYLFFVRHNLGEDVSLRAEKLAIRKMDQLSTESLSWLLVAMCKNRSCNDTAEKLRGSLLNRINETATTASITRSSYSSATDYSIFYSTNREEAVLIQALLYDNPQSTLINKLVTGLLAARKGGHWLNTQENAFALFALDSYLERFEKSTPDFISRIWLAKRCIAENQYKGRGTKPDTTVVEMRQLQSNSKDLDLILHKQGQGALYYRATLKYAVAKPNLPAMSQGFKVTRTYESDNKNDVYLAQDGQWHIKAGALVKVRISMVAPGERHHVMLLDPLPAGLEAINPELSGQAPVVSGKASSTTQWWRSYWFDHQSMRDAHVEAYASQLAEGQYDYTYFARATSIGHFAAPPAKAEEMYSPETFGRSKSDRLVVE